MEFATCPSFHQLSGLLTPRKSILQCKRRTSSIPVIAILDTNCDPDEVEYKIPGNDDAIRSVALLTRVIADAVVAGMQARQANNKPEPAAAAVADVAAELEAAAPAATETPAN